MFMKNEPELLSVFWAKIVISDKFAFITDEITLELDKKYSTFKCMIEYFTLLKINHQQQFLENSMGATNGDCTYFQNCSDFVTWFTQTFSRRSNSYKLTRNKTSKRSNISEANSSQTVSTGFTPAIPPSEWPNYDLNQVVKLVFDGNREKYLRAPSSLQLTVNQLIEERLFEFGLDISSVIKDGLLGKEPSAHSSNCNLL
jgi:hypothetical protein